MFPSIHAGVWIIFWALVGEGALNRKHWQGRINELKHVLSRG
jgi:hypothetical protein